MTEGVTEKEPVAWTVGWSQVVELTGPTRPLSSAIRWTVERVTPFPAVDVVVRPAVLLAT